MTPRVRAAPKIVALAVVAAYSLVTGFERAFAIEGKGSQLAFFAILAAASTGLVGAALTRPGWLRWAYALLFAAGAFYVETFVRASGAYLTYDAHINMLASTGFVGDAIAQNGRAFAGAAGVALLTLVAIGIGPTPALRRALGLTAAALPVVVAFAVTLMLYVRGGDGAKGLPPSYTAFSYAILERYETFAGGLGPREGVKLARKSAPLYNKIVLVIDESVAGNYLDTGGMDGAVPTPLTRDWPGLSITNYGIAAAITNCSVGSNEALRFGGTRDAYLRQIAKGPSLWSHAKAAGLRTVYIDAQRTGGAYQNGMDDDEREAIDEFVQFDGVAVQDRDMAAARRLTAILTDPRPSFVILNKVGAHFPVHDKFPDDFARYAPELERGGFTTIADTGSRAGFSGSPDAWRRYRNSYRNTLLWNVGEFFDRLLKGAPFAQTLLVYTSDHGQDLHENGHPGTTTHCQPDPLPQEGAVPLVIVQGERAPLTFAAEGTTSHYRIAPTLLAAMGYDRAGIRREYGAALDEGGTDPASFNTRFNARLGQKPEWRRIVPRRLPAPPASD